MTVKSVEYIILNSEVVLRSAFPRAELEPGSARSRDLDLSVCVHLRHWLRSLGNAPPGTCGRDPVLRGGSRADWCTQQEAQLVGSCYGMSPRVERV